MMVVSALVDIDNKVRVGYIVRCHDGAIRYVNQSVVKDFGLGISLPVRREEVFMSNSLYYLVEENLSPLMMQEYSSLGACNIFSRDGKCYLRGSGFRLLNSLEVLANYEVFI